MKSYTDLKQTKKLAEFLPLESADMCYIKDKPNIGFLQKEYKEFGDTILQDYYPCWSLAALLDILESEIDGEEGETYELNIEKDGTWWNIWYRERYDEANPVETESTEELIDACYEMIIRLNKLKML